MNLKGGKIVVAHPDDEILFFNSVIPSCKQIIICFGQSALETVTEGRKNITDKFPADNVDFLNIPEADVFRSANFNKPVITKFGLLVNRNRDRYEQNYYRIIKTLRLSLKHGDTVFTHNPWGEYGNEEHVQVFNALHEIQNDLNLSILVSGYVNDTTWKLMASRINLLTGDAFLLPTDKERGEQFKAHYQRHNCWTWHDDYTWPCNEVFHKICSSGQASPYNQGSNHTSLPPLSILGNGKRPYHGKRSFSTRILRPIKKVLPRPIKNVAKKMLGKDSRGE